jgi:hypothetical protein
MRWLRQWLGAIRWAARGYRPERTPAPAGWNKTIDDLMAEKRAVGAEEIEWAREYERSQLRPWARFPRDGEVFEAEEDVEIGYLTHWAAPYTFGGQWTIRKGMRVRVAVPLPDEEPIGVYAAPLDAGLETQIVPEADRTSRKYAGFSLFVKTDQLNKHFRTVT